MYVKFLKHSNWYIQITSNKCSHIFTIWIAFVGKLQASILLNIYVFTSQLENPNPFFLFFKISEKQETPIIKQNNIFWPINFGE